MRIGLRRPEEARVFDGKAGYHSFADGGGSFEVFWHDGDDDMKAGWYWWPCFPGCLPDGDASGPFGSSHDAYYDAIEED